MNILSRYITISAQLSPVSVAFHPVNLTSFYLNTVVRCSPIKTILHLEMIFVVKHRLEELCQEWEILMPQTSLDLINSLH